jgi:hypothetical protein
VLKQAESLVGDLSAYKPPWSTQLEEISAAWRSTR